MRRFVIIALRPHRAVRRLAFVLLASVLPLGVAVPAHAQYGMWKGRAVSDLVLEGWPDELDRGEILDGLALRGRRRLLWRRSVDFYPSLLEDDVQRLRLHLARHGFPQAEITPRVVPDGDDVRVVLRVDPGEATRVATARVEGWPADLGPAPAPPDLLRPGQLVRDAQVGAHRDRLRDTLLDRGHAFAASRADLRRVEPSGVEVVWTVTPGPRTVVGSIEVTGVEKDLESLVRESLGFEVDALYSRESMRRAEENLRLLRLFRRIRLDVVPTDSTTVALRCMLQPRDAQTVGFGAGYWTDDGPGGYAAWEHRNLLRRGRGLNTRAEASLRLLGVRGSLNWPALIGARTWGLLSAEFRRENEDAYVLREIRTAFELAKPFSLTTRVRTGIEVSRLDFDTTTDVFEVEDPAGIVTRWRLNFTREGVDDLLDPHRGANTIFEVETAPPGIGSVAEYARITAERARYLPLTSRTTGVLRLGGGLAWPLGDSEDVLVNERLYAGGSRSVRGYRRRELGPVDSGGDPVGGQSKLEASVELRFPLWRAFHGAVFFDAGQVWRETDGVNLGDLATAAGGGLYARTPVGVFRVDLGFPLQDPGPGEPVRVLHISIGQPF